MILLCLTERLKETSNVIETLAYEGIIRHLVNERTSYVDLIHKYTDIFEID
jgi:hypothetical protein